MGKNSPGMKVALDSLGCKLNQAETELLARQLASDGYRLVASPAEADIYILNTCTVTHIADRKSRHLLRRAHRQNPDTLIVATGCYAQRAPDELARIEGVGLVVGNGDKPHLQRILEELGYTGGTVTGDYSGFRTRTLIKVQDGCDRRCAYCIVPLVRGKEQSLPPGEVISEIQRRTAQGYKEVVLTGVNIGSYDYRGINLDGLLKRILAETSVVRLRLSSLQPLEITTELIDLWGDGWLCPHFHLCLQSGSNRVLSRMRRYYSRDEFEGAVALIRNRVPEAAITTDIMVGFPGETPAEFEESYDFCKRLGFARIHVFAYSPRQGTAACRFPNQISDRVKKERMQRMLMLARGSAMSFSRRFFGKGLGVLFEGQSGGVGSGLTGNYIRVYTRSSDNLTNKLLRVRLVEGYRDGVWGEII
ncbi:MAG: tRNA (N(6)-L-threonylcarbamoyladenosine(37)-C(2))-methylthiotransferase MtaB [Dehalococcoidales bacterium]|nr:tRNA (N(6)-L-threonylcarbamoyladenosine(37)-C(2))-methylthiotransferase MtaB [Dehalococcoidales bacterium]